MKRSLVMILCCLAVGGAFGQTRVALLPTIHGLHKSNARYNYDSLRSIVRRIHPGVIAVEIRSIDASADTLYLQKNYPYEMWRMRYWFPDTVIEGFDWLGAELEGKPIPENYWQRQSQVKRLERQLDEDSVYSEKLNACDHYVSERLAILKNSSLDELLRSKDAGLTRSYYDCMRQQLKGSTYAALPHFYDERNRQMQVRLKEIIRKYPGKTIVILTGDDHYPYLMKYLATLPVQLVRP